MAGRGLRSRKGTVVSTAPVVPHHDPDDQKTPKAGGGPRQSPGPFARGPGGLPALPRSFVPRRLLWGRLDEATTHPVTMVVAPAGAGKTLGLAGWLRQAGLEASPIWFDASRHTTVSDLAGVLDLGGSDLGTARRLVVVDDAQLLSRACVRHIDERLGRDPDSLWLVLVTRWDLALAKLVPELLGHLTVLRGDSLRLDRDEAAQLVEAHDRSGSAEVREAIVASSDGWCAALVLTARSSSTRLSTRGVTSWTADVGHSIADLVAGEVFSALHRRERHLLLCTANEPILTGETARHLTGDPHADEVLATLESTGLLVNRIEDEEPPGGARGPSRYRNHPLLLEVARRRLATGGVDVQQANATVLRAARLDRAQGDTKTAFRRLLQLGEYDEAADILAEHGPRLVMQDPDRWVEHYLCRGELTLDDHPRTWSTIAFSRWSAGGPGGWPALGRTGAEPRRHPPGIDTGPSGDLRAPAPCPHRCRTAGRAGGRCAALRRRPAVDVLARPVPALAPGRARGGPPLARRPAGRRGLPQRSHPDQPVRRSGRTHGRSDVPPGPDPVDAGPRAGVRRPRRGGAGPERERPGVPSHRRAQRARLCARPSAVVRLARRLVRSAAPGAAVGPRRP